MTALMTDPQEVVVRDRWEQHFGNAGDIMTESTLNSIEPIVAPGDDSSATASNSVSVAAPDGDHIHHEDAPVAPRPGQRRAKKQRGTDESGQQTTPAGKPLMPVRNPGQPNTGFTPRLPQARRTEHAYAPHRDRWGTNHASLVGRVTNAPVVHIRPTSGGSFNRYEVGVYEPHHGDDGFNPIMSKVHVLIPKDAPMLNATFDAGRMVTVTGRVVIRTNHDPRYATQSEFGGALHTQPYVLASSAAQTVGVAGRQQYAIVHVAGTVKNVYRRSLPRYTFEHDLYRLVLLEVVETFDRPAPARGTRIEKQTLNVLVPQEIAGNEQIVVGQSIQCEVMFSTTTQWLGNNHYALQGVATDALADLRKRDKVALIMTYIKEKEDVCSNAPAAGVVAESTELASSES